MEKEKAIETILRRLMEGTFNKSDLRPLINCHFSEVYGDKCEGKDEVVQYVERLENELYNTWCSVHKRAQEITGVEQRCKNDIAKLEELHEKEIDAITVTYEEEIDSILTEHDEEVEAVIDELAELHAEMYTDQEKEYAEKLTEVTKLLDLAICANKQLELERDVMYSTAQELKVQRDDYFKSWTDKCDEANKLNLVLSQERQAKNDLSERFDKLARDSKTLVGEIERLEALNAKIASTLNDKIAQRDKEIDSLNRKIDIQKTALVSQAKRLPLLVDLPSPFDGPPSFELFKFTPLTLS